MVVEEPALRVLHSEPFVHELTKPRLLTSVIEETNQNLTAAQKELLLKHWIYGHAMMRRIQKLLRPTSNLDEGGRVTSKTLLILKSAHPSASRCKPPMCAACQLEKMKKIEVKCTVSKQHPKKGNLGTGLMQPGYCAVVDQFVVKVLGRLPNTAGKERIDNRYTGGTIFVDLVSGFTFVKMQVSLRACETLLEKDEFENTMISHGEIGHKYHRDNIICVSKSWM